MIQQNSVILNLTFGSINQSTFIPDMRKFLLVLVFFACAIVQSAQAQERTVTGTVRDAASGEALPGVTILVQGTSTGTVTDMNGTYSISVDPTATLVYSFIGYVQQALPVNNRSVIDVSLSEDVEQLGEVVVVGYGTQEKRDVTGAVASIDAKNFNQGVIVSPDQLFQGKLTGVQVTSTSGEPGAGVNITIRGASSIRSGNDPLIVVDGFPLSGGATNEGGVNQGLGTGSPKNPLSFLNPDDIQSIDVLKDASATAIYGSRGANGVVLITTKSGKQGKGTVTYSTYAGISYLPQQLDLLTADNYVERAVAGGASESAVNFGGSTDWQDQIFQTGLSQSHNLSFGGGSEKTLFRFSLGYLDQDGIVEKSDFERYSARVNGSHQFIQDKLKLDFQITGSRTENENVPISNNAGYQGSLIGAALQANPTIPVTYTRDDGTVAFVQRNTTVNGVTTSNDFRNPMALLAYISDQEETTRILGNIGLTWSILDNLSYRANIGIDNSSGVRRQFFDPRLALDNIQNVGRANLYNRYLESYLMEHFLTYKLKFGESNMELLGGYSYQQFRNRGHRFGVESLPSGDEFIGFDNVDGGVAPPSARNPFASDHVVSKLQSFFGRANFSLADKYLVTATLRADGSSKFGAANRYGLFPALALGWRLSEEAFIPEFFTDLKLRGGWGITGNQEIPAGISRAQYSIDNNSGGLTLVSTQNDQIQWEESQQWNIGLDFSILQGRLNATIDYFNKNTTNLLIQIETPQPAPTRFAWRNLDADIINTGLELGLSYVAIDRDDFTWDIAANSTFFFTNEVRNLGTFYNTGQVNGQGLSGAYVQRIVDNQPLYVFYGQQFEGIDDQGRQIFANDGALTYLGSPHPDAIFGLTNSLTYKAFDLSFNFNGRRGGFVYNNTANALFLKGALRTGRNVTTDVADNNESPNEAPIVSSRYLEKGDFIRLNNATLGYNFKPTGSTWLSNVRVYLSGQNLLLFDQYSGYDPEVSADKSLGGIPSLNIDYTGFPRPRTVIAGVNVTF